MMAFLGHWLGFEAENEIPATTQMKRRPQPGIVICTSKNARKANGGDGAAAPKPLRKTKSDELLRDFEVMRFLGRVDELLKEEGKLVPRADLDRLQTLHAQAISDECVLLADIIEHFEMEHDKLRFRLASAGPSSAAADALRSRNMLVF